MTELLKKGLGKMDEPLCRIDNIFGKRNYFIDYGMALDIYGLLPMAYGELVDIVIPLKQNANEIIIKLNRELKKTPKAIVALAGESKKINEGLICGTVVVVHKRKFKESDYIRAKYNNLKLNVAKPEKSIIDCLLRDDFYRNELAIPALVEGLEFGNIDPGELLKIARSENIYNYVKKLIKDIKEGKVIENVA